MGGLRVQTPAHAPMPKLSLLEYHAGMAADAQAQSIFLYFKKVRGFGVNPGGDSSAVVPQPDR
jgi:hypothetical protein